MARARIDSLALRALPVQGLWIGDADGARDYMDCKRLYFVASTSTYRNRSAKNGTASFACGRSVAPPPVLNCSHIPVYAHPQAQLLWFVRCYTCPHTHPIKPYRVSRTYVVPSRTIYQA